MTAEHIKNKEVGDEEARSEALAALEGLFKNETQEKEAGTRVQQTQAKPAESNNAQKIVDDLAKELGKIVPPENRK